MSEFGDLLELLHGAKGRYHSLRSTWRTWQHQARSHAAFIATAERRGSTLMSVGIEGAEPPPPEMESIVRFWLQAPDRIREEDDGSLGYSQLAIQVGSTWWAYSPAMGAMTNGGNESHGHGIGQRFEALLDPARIVGLLDFEVVGSGDRAGRHVIGVLARPRPGGEREMVGFGLHTLGTGADEYQFEVDAERGVILRSEARLEGSPYAVLEALEVAFDERLDPELFVFEAPPGEELHTFDVEERFRPNLPIHEAASSAPFTVYVPAKVPADWQLEVMLDPGSKRPPRDAYVSLGYRSRDATAQLNVGETAASTADPGFQVPIEEAEEVQRDGLTMRVRARTKTWSQSQLSTTLGETFITMNSTALTAEDLIALACSLTPASDQPPTI